MFSTTMNVSKETCHAIAEEAYRLSQDSKAKGRTLRRFLSRVSNKGTVCQALAEYDQPLSKTARRAVERCASTVREDAVTLMTFDEALLPQRVETINDELAGVFNAFYFDINVNEAPVRELRKMLTSVSHLAESLWPFVKHEEALVQAAELELAEESALAVA